ncbi:MAG: HepT-like ribonuclease domain-containing protein [Methylocella sp.]
MRERSIAPRLADVVEAIEHIRSVLAAVSLEDFEGDWQKRWLIERGLEIISEASRHLPDDIKSRHSEIPWRKIAGIGNVLRHNYERIALDVLWKLAQDDLPALDRVCRQELVSALTREKRS